MWRLKEKLKFFNDSPHRVVRVNIFMNDAGAVKIQFTNLFQHQPKTSFEVLFDLDAARDFGELLQGIAAAQEEQSVDVSRPAGQYLTVNIIITGNQKKKKEIIMRSGTEVCEREVSVDAEFTRDLSSRLIALETEDEMEIRLILEAREQALERLPLGYLRSRN